MKQPLLWQTDPTTPLRLFNFRRQHRTACNVNETCEEQRDWRVLTQLSSDRLSCWMWTKNAAAYEL